MDYRREIKELREKLNENARLYLYPGRIYHVRL